MDQIRCRSCGELKDWDQIYSAQFWPEHHTNLEFLMERVCRDCVNAFLGGKMHADATTGIPNG